MAFLFLNIILLSDHSHFESVIERLQQAASQAKQESNENESIAVTGEEEVEEPAEDNNVWFFIFVVLFC